METNPTSRGVVQIGACYGAWTLDTIQEPVHKTADNNLALHYLKGGSRAYIADTHLSYSTADGAARRRRGPDRLRAAVLAGHRRGHDAHRRLPGGQGRDRAGDRRAGRSRATSTPPRSTSRPSTTWSTWGAPDETLPDPRRRPGPPSSSWGSRSCFVLGAPVATAADELDAAMHPADRPSPRRWPRPPPPRSCACSTRPSRAPPRTVTKATDFGIEHWVVEYTDTTGDAPRGLRISIVVDTGHVEVNTYP